jgi:hypothetical protein
MEALVARKKQEENGMEFSGSMASNAPFPPHLNQLKMYTK